jgi:ribonuclease Z
MPGAACRFGCGRWAIPIGSLDAVVLTHFHSDHTTGLPDVWLTGWIGTPYGGRTEPFRVFGPTGTKTLMEGLQTAYQADIDIRLVDEGNPPEGIAVEAAEFAEPGVIYDEGGLKLTAFEVDHGEAIKPAFGIRADYDGRSAVISGDTRFSENVIVNAEGVDLLIHELGTARPELLEQEHARRVIAHHTTPEEAGTVFARANPKLAAYTHLVMLSGPGIPSPSLTEIVAETRRTYGGPLVVGEDLMTFDIGEEGVATYVRSGS